MVRSYIPKSYGEALDILSKGDLTIMAGGTDLMVKKRNRAGLLPSFQKDVLFLSGIKELSYINKENSSVRIGSMTTLEEILYSKQIPSLLREAAAIMASPGIRHTATLGGNIGNASPAGDTLPVLYLYNAMIIIESKRQTREVPIEEFITGPGRTTFGPGELIKEIVLEEAKFNVLYYKKIGGRKTDAISKVSFAAGAFARNGIVEDIRMAFGAVSPRVARDRGIEDSIKGTPAAGILDLAEEIRNGYGNIINPIDDQRSNAKYRKKCCMNMIDDFLGKVFAEQ
ncbi:MAG: FAD binding domain-containing protein [Clostridia bacterium]|nr:FAD binding domain-containing protein [Clostridia bacterium]